MAKAGGGSPGQAAPLPGGHHQVGFHVTCLLGPSGTPGPGQLWDLKFGQKR